MTAVMVRPVKTERPLLSPNPAVKFGPLQTLKISQTVAKNPKPCGGSVGAVAVNFMAWGIALAIAGAALGQQSSNTEADAQNAILSYYPPSARAAKIEGQATLECGRTPQAALNDCTLVSEEPPGYGFGVAAMTLSKASVPNPKISGFKDRRGPVVFSFRLSPASITPNTLLPVHIITHPDYARKPDTHNLERVWPTNARNLTGRVSMDCIVTVDGKLDPCTILEEKPAGVGFGDAALKYAKTIQMKPGLYDGEPRGGFHALFPISFGAQR